MCAADYERFVALLYGCNGTEHTQIANLYKAKSYQGRTLINRVKEIDRGEPLVDIGAYCLMPNHFHLLVREVSENGVSRFMQKLMTAYTMYFNKKYDRTGALFQGKFKAQHATNDEYLKYLLAYIHLNPVKLIDPAWKEAGSKNAKRSGIYLENYAYSSYSDYCGTERAESAILNKNSLPQYYSAPLSFKTETTEWLQKENPLSTEVEP